jgi:hypothetical protein
VSNCTFDATVLAMGNTYYTETWVEVRDCVFSNGSVLEAPIHTIDGFLDEPVPEVDGFRFDNLTFQGDGSTFVVLGEILDASVDDLTIREGACIRMLHDSIIRFDPYMVNDGRYVDGIVVVAPENETDYEMSEMDERVRLRTAYIIWEDGATDFPDEIEIALTSDDYTYPTDMVVWFASLDTSAEETALTVPDWGDMEDLMVDLTEVLGVYSWWSGD